MTEGDNAVAVGAGPGDEDEYDNVYYVGITSGTRAEILTAVADPANWVGSDTDYSPITTDFTIESQGPVVNIDQDVSDGDCGDGSCSLRDAIGTDSVALDPVGGVYDYGTVVTLTATPDADSEFTGWSGALSGTTSPVALTMDGDQAITATFDLLPVVPTYTLTVLISPTVGGSVTLNPSGGVYAENTTVTMTAVPASDYKFVGWSDGLVSTLNPMTITMTWDMTVTANFDKTGFVIYLPLVIKNH